MEYLSEEIRERFGSDNCCPKFLEPQSIENVTDQEIYSDGDPSEPHYYDLSEKQYTTSTFSSHFTDESSRGAYSEFTDENSRGYSEFNFITQMPLEVHIRSEDYEEDTSERFDMDLRNAPDEKYMIRKRRAESQRRRREQWDDDKRKFILERERIRQRMRRANFSEDRRKRELELGKLRQRNRRAMYTPEQLEKERELNRQRQRERRNQMSIEQRKEELEISKIRQKMKRANRSKGPTKSAKTVKMEDKETQCDLESEPEEEQEEELIDDDNGNRQTVEHELENSQQITESQTHLHNHPQIVEQRSLSAEREIGGNSDLKSL